jgi:hypothetical protein
MARDRSIVLPVAALLKQYKEYPDSTIIRHFDLLFIQQSIGKLSSSVRNPDSVLKLFWTDKWLGTT